VRYRRAVNIQVHTVDFLRGGLERLSPTIMEVNMGYVIVGGICLMIGGCIGVFLIALVSVGKGSEGYERTENSGEEV
jgi:hypothetical protein